MRLNKGLSLILVLVLVIAPILVAKPAFSQPPVFFEVRPEAVPPLTDLNASVNGLETPAKPSPIGDYFTVTIHFEGATAANVPAGVAGLEMHFDFSNILTYAKPINFTDETGTFLSSPLFGLGPAWFAANGSKLPNANGATQYEVAAATSSAGNVADGVVVVLWFQITGQPSQLAGQDNFLAELTISFASAVDGGGNSITVGTVQGTLQIDASLPVLPEQPVVSVIFPDTGTSAFTGTYGQLFNATVVITSDPYWDVAGYDITVSWDPSLMTLIAWAPNSFLTQGGASIFTFNFTTDHSIEVVATKLSDPTPSAGTNVALIYLQFNATTLSNSFPAPTSTIALGPVDLVSWAHPERTLGPWFGSITAVDMSGFFSVTNGTYTAPFISLGASIDLYDQYPTPYGGQGPLSHSDAFGPQSLVNLYSKVTFAQDAIPNKLVSVEIVAPNGTIVTTLVSSTNGSGIATTSFRVPQDSSLFGWWSATATAEIDGKIATDIMAFQVGWLVQVTGITANNAPYVKYSNTIMNFTVTVQTISEQTLAQRGWPNATLATEVYDASNYPIGEVLMNVAGISADRTDVNGPGGTTGGIYTYTVTMPLPDFARVGAATVTGFVLTAMPINGGTPLGPELTPATVFSISLK